MNDTKLKDLQASAARELHGNIIPFWLKYSMDHKHGGFIGGMSPQGVIRDSAPKGLILNSRILWSFSALHLHDPRPEYLNMAKRAFEYLTLKFQDHQYGGYYWMLSCPGEPVDVKKKIYGQAFMVYALSEYARASGDGMALDLAKKLYRIIEKKARDTRYPGYLESYNRDWTLAEDYRLSDKDMDEKKSMNTHLHLLEAYTNLHRVWPNEKVKKSLKMLIQVFLNHIYHSGSRSFGLFFDEKWDLKTDHVSFGHDIEGSWLLVEAADELGDPDIMPGVREQALCLAGAARRRGLDRDGGMLYEGDSRKVIDGDKHWWPQAEAVVGFLNAWQLSGDPQYIDAACGCWQFIEKYMVDRKYGEWFYSVSRKGKPDPSKDKICKWKGPYHNVRACLEIIRRTGGSG